MRGAALWSSGLRTTGTRRYRKPSSAPATPGTDAVEFMLAGATAVAVGTANFVEPRTAVRIADGLEAFCAQRGIARVSELTGALITPRTPSTVAKRDEKKGSR